MKGKYDPSRFKKDITAIEEAIEYNNTNVLLLNIDDWYIIKTPEEEDEDRKSLGYHSGCNQLLMPGAPFLHYRALRCRGCGELPPEGIASLYVLHNMDHLSRIHEDAD